jgi:hypothetical protein
MRVYIDICIDSYTMFDQLDQLALARPSLAIQLRNAKSRDSQATLLVLASCPTNLGPRQAKTTGSEISTDIFQL